jgi:hypothetical protein
MRCLQCAKPLALLKKLTDSDFCSAEHRKLFLEEQQRLMIERLGANRLRILKSRGTLDLPPATEIELPLVETVLAEAETVVLRNPPAATTIQSDLANLCQFLTEGVYPKADLAPPRYNGEAAPSDLRLVSSLLSLAIPAARTATARLLPVFLPVRSSDRRYSSSAVEEFEGANCDTVAGRDTIRLPIPTHEARSLRTVAGAFRMRPRGPLGCSAVPEFSIINPALEPAAGSIMRPRLQSRGAREYPLQFLDRFFRARPRGPLACERLRSFERISAELLPSPVSSPAVPALPELGRLESTVRSLPLSDRALLIRPRGPLQTAGRAGSGSLAENEPLNPAVAYASLSAHAIGDCAPPLLDRAFRMRPRSGVSSPALAAYLGIPADLAHANKPTLVYASLPAESTSCSPAQLDKLYKMRPRGPVEDAGVRTTENSGTGILHITAARHALPALPVANSSCIPAIVDRAYKMRPKGPVHDDGISQSQPIAPGAPETLVSSPLIRSRATEAASERAPWAVDRPVSIHPRGPVGPQRAGDFECGLVREGALLSGPSLPALPAEAFGFCAPAVLHKLYRMRPKSGVADQKIALSQPIASLFVEMKSTTSATPSGLRATAALSPAFLEKLYRMRPRAGVLDGSLRAFENLDAGQSTALISSPVAPAAGLTPASQLGPSPVSSAFRMRPRGPVNNASPGTVEKAGQDGLLPLLIWASPSLGSIAACSPPPVDKPYRMRPRAGVQDRNLPGHVAVESGNGEPLLSMPWIPGAGVATSTSLTPNFLDRAFRMRPRGPVQKRGSASIAALTASTSALKISALPALPPPVQKICTPLHLDRAYRMRPRGPVQARSLAEFEPIQPGCAITMLPVASLPDMPALAHEERTPVILVKPGKKGPGGPAGSAGNPLEGEAGRHEQIGTGSPVAFSAVAALPGLPPSAQVECGPRVPGALLTDPRAGYDPALQLTEHVDTEPIVAAGVPRLPLAWMAPDSSVAPVLGNRLYRLRPPSSKPANTPEMFSQPMDAIAASLRHAVPSLSATSAAAMMPALRDRLFTQRARGVNQAETPIVNALGREIQAQVAPLFPALSTAPGIVAGPVLVERLYRRKLQAREPAAAIDSAVSSSLVAQMTPAIPVSLIGAVSYQGPMFLDCLYRTRPRGPVTCGSALVQKIASEPQVLEAAAPVIPAVATVPFLWQPVELHQLHSLGQSTLREGAMTPARFEVLTAAPSPAVAMPATRPYPVNEVPSFVNRLYRVRPVAVDRLRAFAAIAVSHEELQQASMPVRADFSSVLAPLTHEALLPCPTVFPLATAEFFVLRANPLPAIAIHELAIGIEPVKPSIKLRSAPVPSPVLAGVREAFARVTEHGAWVSLFSRWSLPTFSKWPLAASNYKIASLLLIVLFGSFLTAKSLKRERPVRREVETASLTANPVQSIRQVISAPLDSFRHGLATRAAVDLTDDFSSGLHAWSGTTDWAKSWSYDQSGGIRPGQLSLFTPSLGMTDYKVDFVASIEEKALALAFRAADLRNYHVVKIVTTRPGPLPRISILHYAVVNGKEGPHHETPIPLSVTASTLYRGQLDVNGRFFTLSLEGKIVDFWTDDRLSSGGIGLFSGKGELARIQKIRVAHQDDALGKLCAYLGSKNRAVGGSPNE